jgi:replicative DNA helicase
MDFEITVLAGIVDKPALRHRVPNLGKSCFTGARAKLFGAMVKLGSKLSPTTLSSRLYSGKVDPKVVAEIGPTLRAVIDKHPSLSDWSYAVDQLFEGTRLRLMETSVRKAFGLVKAGRQAEAEGVLTVLPREMRTFRGRGRTSLQDFRSEAGSILTDGYSGPRMPSKLTMLDKVIRGFRRGQLVLWGAYAHHAKTTFSVHFAEQLLLQGRNIFFATLELTSQQIGALFLTMHSHAVYDGGLPFLWFDDHEEYVKLTEEDQNRVQAVVNDFSKDGRKSMGSIRICHPELDETVLDIFDRADQYADEIGAPVDAVIIDYLEIVRPIRYKVQTHDALRESLTNAKHFSKTSQGGQGTLVWSPWQIRRESFREVSKRGFYVMSDFAESAFAERAADVMGWNLFGDSVEGCATMRMGVCKNRTTRTLARRGFEIRVDSDTCLFEDLDTGGSMASVADDLE